MEELLPQLAVLESAPQHPIRQPRSQPIRAAILRFLTEPRSAGDIAEHIARPVPTATGHLCAMIRLGLVQRLAFGTYAPASYSGPAVRLMKRRSNSAQDLRIPALPVKKRSRESAPPASERPPRPQPIRDAILRFLTEPRSAGAIAEHIDRPVPTATGHLGAMIRLGLVQRLAFGTYAPAGYCGPTVKLPNRRSHSSRDLRQRLREHLRERCSVQGLRLRTGASEAEIRLALRDLWLSGLVEGGDEGGYTLSRWQHEK